MSKIIEERRAWVSKEIESLLAKLKESFHISDEEAGKISDKALQYIPQKVRGNSFDDWIRASLYVAYTSSVCSPMTFKDYCEIIGTWGGRGIWRLVKKLRWMDEQAMRKPCYIKPHIYIQKLGDVLKLSKRVIGQAYRMADSWTEINRGTTSAKGDACAIVWCVAHGYRSQVEVAEAVGITVVALRARLERMRELNLAGTKFCLLPRKWEE